MLSLFASLCSYPYYFVFYLHPSPPCTPASHPLSHMHFFCLSSPTLALFSHEQVLRQQHHLLRCTPFQAPSHLQSQAGGVLPLQLVGAPTQVWWAPSFQGLHLHTATPGCGVSWLQAALQKRSCLPQSSDNDVQTEIIHLPCGPKEQLMVRSVPCLKEEKNDCNIS